MTPDIVAVPVSEKADLWAMFQLYGAELAPMANMELTGGDIPYEHFDDYWRDEQRWPFWAMCDGKPVGFALIRFAPEHSAMQIAEFFILPEHRRDGAGLSFARALFARYPGPWKMRQMAANTAAIAFWRRVAEPYGYTEETYMDKGLGRVEQTLTAV
jgi:predicted acetyltransferase